MKQVVKLSVQPHINFVNTLHEHLRFIVEEHVNNKRALLDLEMNICGHSISSKW